MLDEFYWLNKKDPNRSLQRVTIRRGEDAKTENKFGLSDAASKDMVKLFMTRDRDLYDKKITDVFGKEFLESNFWLYWRTMFAFENWHSALEMKLYLQRFIHHIGGLPDLSALKFTKYNQYESLILPMMKYLEAHDVHFQYGTKVTNVEVATKGGRRVAKRIVCERNGKTENIDLIEDDLVFVTNGSCTENSSMGDQDTPATINRGPGGAWELWRNLARQDGAFGNPEKFCSNIEATKWESATVTTLDDRIPPYIEKICKRDPFSGKVVTGGIVSAKDSAWLLSWTLNRQPHFKAQKPDQLVVWVYGLFSDVSGDYVKKAMKDCTGKEITMEWLYHMGVPVELIPDLAENSARCVPVMMPYITAFFMPRAAGDRPKVVPEGSVNLAFLGQFADTGRDTVFTTEYSVRTAMEAVYTLLDVDRGVPEPFASVYDVRTLLSSTVRMMDGAKPADKKLPFPANLAKKVALKKVKGTVIEEVLERYGIM